MVEARPEFRGEGTFVLALSDRLRKLEEPLDILGEAAGALGAHLGASRAGYAEVEADGDSFVIERDWTDGSVKQGTGRRSMLSFGTQVTAMLHRGETQCIADMRTDPRVRPQDRGAFEEMRIEAAVTVPLVKSGRLVAMFSVQQSRPRAWADAEVALIEDVAERTWAAYERARTAERLRESEATLAFLLELSDRTRAEPDPEAILASTAEMIGRRLDAARVTYGELDEDETAITVAHAWADGLGRAGGTYPLAALGPALLAEHLAGRTIRVDDVATDPRFDGENGAKFGKLSFRSAITVPLTKSGKLRALLSVQDDRPRRWTDVEIRLVEEVAERTWASLERARTAARLAEREANAAFLLELGDRMRGQSTAAGILRDAVESVGRRLHAHRVGYAEVDVAAGVFTAEVEWTDGRLRPVAGRYPLAALGRPLIAALARGETMRIDDMRRHPHIDATGASNLESINTRAAVVVPLIRGGGLVAFMSVQHAAPWPWSDAEVRLIEEVAERTWAVVERARAEAELRDSQALLKAFIANAPVGMYLKDEAGRYVMASAGMDRVFGRPAAEVVGLSADDLFDESVREKIAAQDALALAEGRAQVAEQHLSGAEDGSWTLVIRFPVDLGVQGKRVGGFAIDLTEQKRAEAELARSREALYQTEKLTALGSLLAGLSHEMNNPLSVVVVQSVMMEEDAEGSPLATRARLIRASAERCSKIVQTFLAMARQKPPERSSVDLNRIVDGVLDLTAYGLRSTGVEVVRRLDRALPAIDADADQLHQVLANLVVNAQHALQDVDGARRLTIATRRGATADTVEVEVADTGPGVAEELRRRIFEPFYTTKPQGAGTGLGLSFSHGVVEAHGGRLELLDRPEGAAFLITLPATGAAATSAAPPAAEPQPAARAHALVIDDEPDIADAIAELLERDGYRVRVAGSGAEAKRQLAARDFDLVLSDLRMPDIDGPALHAWIAAERPHLLPRLGFVTGDTIGPNAVRFLAEARRPSLEKPFTPASLRSFVSRVREAAA